MGGFFGLSGTITINDIWFVHERGLRVGLWNMAGIASINTAPIISGYLIVDLGWRWSFSILAISFTVVLVFVIIFMPETSFDRSNMSVITNSSSTKAHSASQADVDSKDSEKSPASEADRDMAYTAIKPEMWKRIIGLGTHEVKGQKHILSNLIAPFLLLRAPAVIWSSSMWSVCFTWLIIQASVAQQIFGAPPYNMDSINVEFSLVVRPSVGLCSARCLLVSSRTGSPRPWLSATRESTSLSSACSL